MAGQAPREEARAQDHQPARVAQGQGTRDVRGGDLALGVADHGGGHDPAASPEPGQRDHRGEQHGLENLDLLKPVARAQHLSHGPVHMLLDRRGDLREVRGEGRGLVDQLDEHAQPLGALAREDHDDASGVATAPGHQVRGRVAGGQGLQTGQRLGAVGGQHGGPVLQPGARGQVGGQAFQPDARMRRGEVG